MADPTPLRNRDQRRAAFAYESLGTAAAQKKAAPKDLKNQVQTLGAFILRDGLAATMAFFERDRDKAAPRVLLEILAAWLAQTSDPKAPGASDRPKSGVELPGWVRRLPLRDYQLYTREFLQLAVWLRRAAEVTLVSKEKPHAP